MVKGNIEDNEKNLKDKLEVKLEEITKKLDNIEKVLNDHNEKLNRLLEIPGDSLVISGPPIGMFPPSPEDLPPLLALKLGPPRLRTIYDYIKANKTSGVTAKELASEIGCKEQTARVYLSQLFKMGVLAKKKEERGIRYFVLGGEKGEFG